MKQEDFKKTLDELNNEGSTDIVKMVLEETETVSTLPDGEASPKDLTLDSQIYVSQEVKDGETKKFEFSICEVWLKPQNMWTIINVKKEKEEKNFWILFYDNGTYYLKKGIKGPIGVHVHLKQQI